MSPIFGGHPLLARARKQVKTSRRGRPARKRKLVFEQLERRELLALVTWVGGSGDWADASHWDNATGPAAGDDAVINVPAISVKHLAGAHTVKSLTINDPFTLSGGTLVVGGNLVQQNSSTFSMTGGTLSSATVVAGGGAVLAVAGGTLDGLTLGGILSGCSHVGHRSEQQ